MTLSNEQKLLLYAISHRYVLLNTDGEMDDDVKRALCGAFNANKIEYKIPDLLKDISFLAQTRLIEKNLKTKRYDVSIEAKSNPSFVLFDKKEEPNLPPQYSSFMRTFWVVFCSFLKGPLLELIKEIYNNESKQLSELTIASDIAAGVLSELAIKRGFVTKDAKGSVTLTQNGIDMVEAELAAENAEKAENP